MLPASLHTGSRRRPNFARPRQRASELHPNGKAHAYRRHPSRRDPGGGSQRQSSRRIRFRILHQKASKRQHLSRKGYAGRAVAASRLCRIRRQPARLSRFQRDPPRLLQDPGRRPEGRRCRAAISRIRGSLDARRGRGRNRRAARASAAGAGGGRRNRAGRRRCRRRRSVCRAALGAAGRRGGGCGRRNRGACRIAVGRSTAISFPLRPNPPELARSRAGGRLARSWSPRRRCGSARSGRRRRRQSPRRRPSCRSTPRLPQPNEGLPAAAGWAASAAADDIILAGDDAPAAPDETRAVA